MGRPSVWSGVHAMSSRACRSPCTAAFCTLLTFMWCWHVCTASGRISVGVHRVIRAGGQRIATLRLRGAGVEGEEDRGQREGPQPFREHAAPEDATSRQGFVEAGQARDAEMDHAEFLRYAEQAGTAGGKPQSGKAAEYQKLEELMEELEADEAKRQAHPQPELSELRELFPEEEPEWWTQAVKEACAGKNMSQNSSDRPLCSSVPGWEEKVDPATGTVSMQHIRGGNSAIHVVQDSSMRPLALCAASCARMRGGCNHREPIECGDDEWDDSGERRWNVPDSDISIEWDESSSAQAPRSSLSQPRQRVRQNAGTNVRASGVEMPGTWGEEPHLSESAASAGPADTAAGHVRKEEEALVAAGPVSARGRVQGMRIWGAGNPGGGENDNVMDTAEDELLQVRTEPSPLELWARQSTRDQNQRAQQSAQKTAPAAAWGQRPHLRTGEISQVPAFYLEDDVCDGTGRGLNGVQVEGNDDSDSGVRRQLGLHDLPKFPHLYHGCRHKAGDPIPEDILPPRARPSEQGGYSAADGLLADFEFWKHEVETQCGFLSRHPWAKPFDELPPDAKQAYYHMRALLNEGLEDRIASGQPMSSWSEATSDIIDLNPAELGLAGHDTRQEEESDVVSLSSVDIPDHGRDAVMEHGEMVMARQRLRSGAASNSGVKREKKQSRSKRRLNFYNDDILSGRSGGVSEKWDELVVPSPLRGGGEEGWGSEMEALFEACVRCIFSRWTVMGLAVSHGWGGQDAGEKRDKLVAHVVSLHRRGAGVVDADELMVFLQDSLVDLFQTEAQDGSCALVAAHVARIAAQLRQGRTDEAFVLTRRAATSNVAASKFVADCEERMAGSHQSDHQGGAECKDQEVMPSCDDGAQFWSDMSSDTQQNWAVLGWNADSWNADAPEPLSQRLAWGQLSDAERTAAKALGFDSISWAAGPTTEVEG